MAPRDLIQRAYALLSDDNLVWSDDFELVRGHLAQEFLLALEAPALRVHMVVLAKKLLGEG